MISDDGVRIRAWAEKKGMLFWASPDPAWYTAWEPYDTMVSPARYINAAVATLAPGHLAIVEP